MWVRCVSWLEFNDPSVNVGHDIFKHDVHLAETVCQIILTSVLFDAKALLIHQALTY